MLEARLERARDKPVLGLAGVELAPRPVGLDWARSTASRSPARRSSCWRSISSIPRRVRWRRGLQDAVAVHALRRSGPVSVPSRDFQNRGGSPDCPLFVPKR
jgi:hypothetical protein